jgi:phosphatidylglycerol---prolipoprotein diacylglyceryl transferase
VTYWFDPVQHPGPYPVTVRFSGRRVDVKGRLSPGDRFVQDETIEEVVPGSGPISLTTRVRGINPGEWLVTARMLGSAHPAHGPQEQGNTTPAAGPPGPLARFWRRWAPFAESAQHVSTCPIPFARVPGIFPGMWGAMVTLGMAVALALQFLVISADHLRVGSWWAVTFAAIVVGIAGAKLWFIVLHRHEHRIEGWCIQGFITGATLAAAILLVALDVPAGVFLDVTASGLLVGLAVGRVGCFFGGCCGGPPTASRWGVWSSDQRVGAHRIPTQLLESVFALGLGLLVLVAVVGHGPASGAFFVAGLATSALAALVLIAAVVLLAR